MIDKRFNFSSYVYQDLLWQHVDNLVFKLPHVKIMPLNPPTIKNYFSYTHYELLRTQYVLCKSAFVDTFIGVLSKE